MAYEAAARARQGAQNNLSDETLVAIILAASAAECFVNDTVGMVESIVGFPGVNPGPELARLGKIARAVDNLETENVRTVAKYLVSAVLLDCKEIDAGREPLQSFTQVAQLRNGIVHAGPVSTEEKNKYASIVANLSQRGLCKPIDETKRNTMDAETWWVVMRTPEVAHWVVKSANELMLALTNAMVVVADYNGVLASIRDSLVRSLSA